MANSWYNDGLHWFGDGHLDWSTCSTLRAALMGSTYTPAVGDSGFSTISAKEVQAGADVAVTPSTNVAGALSGMNVTISGVATGLTVSSIVVYDTAGASGGTLLFWMDTGTGLPLSTTGAAINVAWNGGTGSGLLATL